MRKQFVFLTVCLALILAMNSCNNNEIKVQGSLKTWHKVTLSINGPEVSETGTPNPFLTYRLNVTFQKGDQKYVVPGYFAADGNASETSASSGSVWKAHFCPPEAGTWEYSVSFRQGEEIALSLEEEAGEPVGPDGLEGSFEVESSSNDAPGFLSEGKLRYVGKHHLQFAGSKEYFLKGGADSPENFLAYNGFDGTYYGGDSEQRSGESAPNEGLHSYNPHIDDWKEGDPTWQNGKGKGIIGALNYLSSKGMNSVYFLTMNILGDGEDVWPYTDRNERYRFDCSKLDQWEIVFSHMDSLGIMLHVVLQETENECLLDAGYLDVQRKLYLRELVARFSHHLAIKWNLGEEHHATSWAPYGQTVEDTKEMANYLRDIDPYDNFIAMHTHSNPEKREEDLRHYLGFETLEGPSIQAGNVYNVHEDAKQWLRLSEDSLHPWVVSLDEIGPAWKGALPDEYSPMHDTIRREALWGNLMAGGAGVEWYMGYKFPHNDLNCEDWRSRDNLWNITRYALEFFQNYLPFHEMQNMDDIITAEDAWCLGKEGRIYAVYLKRGGTTDIQLPAGHYSISWYNPREGGNITVGNPIKGTANSPVSIGNPPEEQGEDWVCLIENQK
ncbi:MAG: DUF5060 domain-containing protein [Bacteroidales bacterium]